MRSLFLLFILLLNKPSIAQVEKLIENASFIIKHINVIPMTNDTLLKDQMVIITNNTIAWIGPDHSKNSKLMTKAKIIDGTNKFLMPGMTDMHAHFPPYKELKHYFTLNLMAGVTSIRSMRGDAEHLKIKEDKDLLQLHLYLSAPPITKDISIDKKTADSIVVVSKSSGFNFIKVLSIKDSISFLNLADACKSYQLPFCGHGLSNIPMDMLLKSGYNSIEHLTGYAENLKKGESYVDALITLTAKNKVYNCATEDYFELGYNMQDISSLKKRNGLQYIPDTTIARWDKEITKDQAEIGEKKLKEQREYYTKYRLTKNKILVSLAKSGAPLLIGPDAGGAYAVPGFAMQEEMRHHANAGLTNYQVLCMATINAATYIKKENNSGTVEKGKEANLILLGANPLLDLNNLNLVEAVFIHSDYKTIQELQAGLK